MATFEHLFINSVQVWLKAELKYPAAATSGVGHVQKNSQNKNTLSELFLPLQMQVQNHERVQIFCFYPFRKKLKENPAR